MKLFEVRHANDLYINPALYVGCHNFKEALEMVSIHTPNLEIESIVLLSDDIVLSPVFEASQTQHMQGHIRKLTNGECDLDSFADLNLLHFILGNLLDGKSPGEVYKMAMGTEWESDS